MLVALYLCFAGNENASKVFNEFDIDNVFSLNLVESL
jgi:hypothetical protein